MLALGSRGIEGCDSQHAGVCHSFSDPWLKIDPPSEILLIDVMDKRLIQTSKSVPYLALSYVWGKAADPLQTALTNLSHLTLKNAFDTPCFRDRLPNTIRDSMRLTEMLHQRYLWVDRFCIVQDDLEYRTRHLKAMASIYANAYLTIVASDGDDDSHGLRGIGEGSKPREYMSREFIFAPDCHMVAHWGDLHRHFVYDTRGWTFQERAVSRRQLVFKSGAVSWYCRLWSWHEDIVRPYNLGEKLGGSDLFSRWPNLTNYASQVSAYSGCKLTYAEDGLNAFSAVTAIVARSMRGGILFGLPEMFFDGCLLWQPRGAVERRRRRRVTSGTIVDGEIIDSLPSWSWVG